VRDFVEALEQAAPSASARVVADWVSDLARDSLAGRARHVAEVEIWDGGMDASDLNSSPFTAEVAQAIGADLRGAQPATPTSISKVTEAGPPPRRFGLLALLLVALALAAAYVLWHEARIGMGVSPSCSSV
jgi:hypothetical protein